MRQVSPKERRARLREQTNPHLINIWHEVLPKEPKPKQITSILIENPENYFGPKYSLTETQYLDGKVLKRHFFRSKKTEAQSETADLDTEKTPQSEVQKLIDKWTAKAQAKQAAPPTVEKFEKLNFRYTFQDPDFRSLDTSKWNSEAALLILRNTPPTSLTIIAEDAGSLVFTTDQLLNLVETNLAQKIKIDESI